MAALFIPPEKQKITLVVSLLGLAIYMVFYTSLISRFNQIGVDPQRYVRSLVSFSSKEIASLNQHLVLGGKLSDYIALHRWNLINPLLFSLSFFPMTVYIIRKTNLNKRLNKLDSVFSFLPLIIAIFDLTATALTLLSVNHPLIVPWWLAIGLGVVNVTRYILLQFFMVRLLWLLIKLIRMMIKTRSRGVRKKKNSSCFG